MKFDFVGSESEEGREIAKKFRKCPLCGKMYSEPPALSRKDNKTEICSLCGTREALEAVPFFTEEQRAEILETVRKGAAGK